MPAKIKTQKKSKESETVPKYSKKDLLKLKNEYKKGKLRFDSKEIARAMLQDESVRKGLTM